MNCVVLQPSYVPWRGFFHMIQRADLFVFYDDVQYDKHGWRNRNRVKTSAGTQWLTIPVHAKGNVETGLPIHEARMSRAEHWPRKHLATLRQSYGRAPFFGEMWPLVESLYADPSELLADFTIESTKRLAEALGITKAHWLRSSDLHLRDRAGVGCSESDRNARLLRLLQHVGATHYISGPSAAAYIDAAAFEAAKISLEYQVYDYPEYTQLHPPYDPRVSVLDLLFMKGSAAGDWIWGSEIAR